MKNSVTMSLYPVDSHGHLAGKPADLCSVRRLLLHRRSELVTGHAAGKTREVLDALDGSKASARDVWQEHQRRAALTAQSKASAQDTTQPQP